MVNLLVLTLCTQGLHWLHGQFVGTHIVHIEPTQVAWAICWYSHCAHRAYIGLHGQFVGTKIVHIEPTQVAWAICWYPLCEHRGYIGCMGNFVGTHIVHIGPTQVASVICWYSYCAHSGLHRLLGQFVGTHIVHIGPTQVAWAICWYPHCAHRAYIGCKGNLLVLTLCTQGLHWLHGQFVGTHIVHIGPTLVAWAICWYPHCAHRAYIGCMGNLLVLHIVHIEPTQVCIGNSLVPTNVNIEPTQFAWAICWYPHCEHSGYIGGMVNLLVPHCAHRAYMCCMGNLLVPTLCTQGLHRLHGQFVGTHVVHIGPTQVAWAICWYSHCAHRAYIGCMGNLLVPTLCTQSLRRLHGQFVGTHNVHIGATQVCMGNFVGTRKLCTQGLHRLHGQFVGTHIVNIGPTQVVWAICWYPHCAHRAYIGCLGNLLVHTLCTQGLHRLHGQFVGTHIVHIGPTQVAWAICWYSHCAHRADIVCMGNLLVPTL